MISVYVLWRGEFDGNGIYWIRQEKSTHHNVVMVSKEKKVVRFTVPHSNHVSHICFLVFFKLIFIFRFVDLSYNTNVFCFCKKKVIYNLLITEPNRKVFSKYSRFLRTAQHNYMSTTCTWLPTFFLFFFCHFS